MFFLVIINVFLGCVFVGIFKFMKLFIVGIFIVVFSIVFIYEILIEMYMLLLFFFNLGFDLMLIKM